MMFISVTRLRLRSTWFLPPFIYFVVLSMRQARQTSGCLGVRGRKTRGLSFWTLTLWESEAAMKTFRMQSSHRQAMPKLSHWSDEASVAHWVQETQEYPTWQQAVDRLLAVGHLSKVSHPSEDQKQGRISVT